MKDSNLEAERDILEDLVRSLPRAPGNNWKKLHQRIVSHDNSGTPRQFEQELHLDIDLVRTYVREAAFAKVKDLMASPGEDRHLPIGHRSKANYGYERSMTLSALESRALKGAYTANNRISDAVLFGSGMAAISSVLKLAAYTYTSRYGSRPTFALLGSYFETNMLVELMRPSFAKIVVASNTEQLIKAGADIVLVEPVRYNWDLEETLMSELSNAWSNGQSPACVVVDSTLSAFTWPVSEFLASIPSEVQVIDLRSGLKLDQQGLELTNMGVAIIYGAGTSGQSGDNFARLLRDTRSICGGGLSAYSVAQLEAGFIFDKQRNTRHSTMIAANNAEFAQSIKPANVLFQKVNHPSLDITQSKSTPTAPFTVLRLEDASVENYELLLGVIRHEAQRRNIDLEFGSSFGFRSHRYETIMPRKTDQKCLLKVAVGARKGPSFRETIELFEDLASTESIAAVRRKYPDAEPQRIQI